MKPHGRQQETESTRTNPKRSSSPTPGAKPCQKEVRPVRPTISLGWLALCIALAAIPGHLWGWIFTWPLIVFAISRLAKQAICPGCRQHIPKAKTTFDTEAAVMTGLIVLCIAGGIGTHIINKINQPSAECATALETVKEAGGPDLWTASDDEIDHWLEEDQDAWDLYDRPMTPAGQKMTAENKAATSQRKPVKRTD